MLRRQGAVPPGALLLPLLLLAWPVAAAELTLTPAEMAHLGVQLAAPQPADSSAGLTARGRVVVPPDHDHVVSAPQPGLLIRLHAVAGDELAAGAVLAELRSPDFLAAQREFLDARSADVLARARLERDRSLVAEGIGSRRRLETTEAEAAAAAAALAEHRQMLQIAGLSTAAIEDLADQRKLQPLLAVRAPIGGVVLENYARVGSGVTVTDPLYRVADASQLWIEIDLPEDRADQIQPGMRVLGERSGELAARVLSVGRVVAPATQTVTVRALVLGDARRLRAGQFVVVRIVTDAAGAEVRWSLPPASVIRSGEEHFVFVRSGDGFAARPVRRLGMAGGRVVVSGALDTDSEVAVAGVSALKALWSPGADATSAGGDA